MTAGSRLVVTCAHVVDGPGPYEFVPDATRRPLAVSVAAKTGPDLDLAVLQPTEPLPPEVLGLEIVSRTEAPRLAAVVSQGFGLLEHTSAVTGSRSVAGRITGPMTRHGQEWLEIDTEQRADGFSGSPVLVPEVGVVAVISTNYRVPAGATADRNAAWTTYADNLPQVHPQIRLRDATAAGSGAGLGAALYRDPAGVVGRAPVLVGRAGLVTEARDRLARGERVLLHGIGGSGKTAAAAEVAAEWIEGGRGPVLWLRLRRASAAEVVEAIARGLGEPQAVLAGDAVARQHALRQALERTSVLLVLDDVWNGAALYEVALILPPGAPLLVTARQRYPDMAVVKMTDLTAPDALALLSLHAGHDMARDGDARRLVTRLAGNPFALEIAGRLLRTDALLPGELLEMVDEDMSGTLVAPGGFAEEGRASLAGLFEATIGALPAEARAAFVAIGAMFAPTVTAAAVGRVLERGIPSVHVPSLTKTALRAALSELSRWGLAERVAPSGDSIVVDLHDLAYDHARSKVGDEDRRVALDLLCAHAERHQEPTAEHLALLRPELENLLAAAAWASRNGRPAELNRLAASLFFERILDRLGLYNSAIGLLEPAVEAVSRLGDRATEARRRNDLGAAYARAGRIDDALESCGQALDIAIGLDDIAEQGTTLGNIAAVQILDERFEEAIDTLGRSLILKRRAGDTHGERNDLGNLGVACRRLGRLSEAGGYYEKAITLGEGDPDATVEVEIGNLGNVHLDLHDHREAIRLYRRALEIAITRPNPLEELRLHRLLGEVLVTVGHDVEALAAYDRMVETAVSLGDPSRIIEARCSAALAAVGVGAEERERRIALALAALDEIDAREPESIAAADLSRRALESRQGLHERLAERLHAAMDIEGAERHARTALAVAEALPDPEHVRILIRLAVILARAGATDADAVAREAVDLAAAQSSDGAVQTLLGLSGIAGATGDPGCALTWARRARDAWWAQDADSSETAATLDAAVA